MDVWEYSETAPEYATATANLWHWSTNYDPGKGPFTLFVDLIGWSDEVLGETLYSLQDMSLGYLEIDKLADALKEYANRPTDVRGWVDGLLEHEGA
jgi:hypothetical protein